MPYSITKADMRTNEFDQTVLLPFDVLKYRDRIEV